MPRDELERVLAAIRQASLSHPTERIGQLMENAVRMPGWDTGLFYVSDRMLSHALNAYCKEMPA